MSLSPEVIAALGGVGGTLVGAGGVAVVNWWKAKGDGNRADGAAANAAWKELYSEMKVERGENRGRIEALETRVDECTEKHADCEERNDKLERRVNELEGSVRSVDRKVEQVAAQQANGS